MVGSLVRQEIISVAPVSWGDGFVKPVSILKLTTSEGHIALGGAYTSEVHLARIWSEYGHRLDLQNPDPKQVAQWVEQACTAGMNRQDLDLIPALSALDIAIWDLKGQVESMPVSQMLGGATDPRIKAYASLEIPLPKSKKDFDDWTAYLDQMLSKGFKAIKLYFPRLGYRNESKSAAQWDQYEESLIARAREIVGPDIALMLDVFGSAEDWQGDFAWAARMSEVLVQHNFLWFEEPLLPDALENYQQLNRQSAIPISACEFFTDPAVCVKWAETQAVDIVQPDCTCSGGISSLVKVKHAALANGVTMIPHGWSTAIGMAADIQVMATMPMGSLRMVEYMPRPSVTDMLQDDPFALDEDGMITISTLPGLGIVLK